MSAFLYRRGKNFLLYRPFITPHTVIIHLDRKSLSILIFHVPSIIQYDRQVLGAFSRMWFGAVSQLQDPHFLQHQLNLFSFYMSSCIIEVSMHIKNNKNNIIIKQATRDTIRNLSTLIPALPNP